MNRHSWCQEFIQLKGRPLSFLGRPYLEQIYKSPERRIVLRCSRQVEKTTFICNTVIHAAVCLPGVHIVVVFPRHEQAKVFAKSRLLPMIEHSPIPKRLLLGQAARKPQVFHMQFRNQSEVYIRAAYHTADAARGIDGDFLLIDEYQDIAPGDLPILEETLSHSPHRRVVLTGTPKTIDNHLEVAFNRSTAKEWQVPCPAGHLVRLDEECFGIDGPICPDCGASIDPSQGIWVARNPDSKWGDGFTLNHLATPWLSYPDLLERRATYDAARFRNECLGLPTFLGDHIVTRQEVEACCGELPLAQSWDDVPPEGRGRLIAGIDWGGGSHSATVLVIGYLREDDQFVVVFWERLPIREEPDDIVKALVRRCHAFQVPVVAADGGGNGSVYNNLLLHALPRLSGMYAIYYSQSDQAPRQYKGRLWNWTIGRTPSISMVFTRIKKQRICFPRLEDSRTFVDEIWCEVAEYDDEQRSIKYTHSDTQPDDTLHALNYATILARRGLNGPPL